MYEEMVKKMRVFQMLKGGKTASCNPKLVADLTADSVSPSQVENISGYLREWESVVFDDKRRVLDTLISQVRAISEQVVIHWKL